MCSWCPTSLFGILATGALGVFDAMGDLFHTKFNLITGALILVLCIVIVSKSQKKFQKNDPALIIAGIIFYGAAILGFVSWYIVGIASLMLVLYIGYILIFRQASG